jgi:deoxyribodipyrimidine photo-lyase
MRRLRASVRVAKEVGEGLGTGSLLQRALPPHAAGALNFPMELFPSERQGALQRLEEFVQSAAAAYPRTRNFVKAGHGNVSRLSAALRHRLVSEEEVIDAVLAAHRFSAVEKFVQEVAWRTYWKGWLEQRPGVWTDYLRQASSPGPDGAADILGAAASAGAMSRFTEELRATGYMHNHARMWWAAWWCHQHGLPWAAGARFFFDHLIDADAASNTLGWRWVAGLQTPGKTYITRRDNLHKYWEGVESLEGIEDHVRARIPAETADRSRHPLPDYPEVPPVPAGAVALLGHADDLSIETTPLGTVRPGAVALIGQHAETDSPVKRAWRSRAMEDASARWAAHYAKGVSRLPRWEALPAWLGENGCGTVVLMAPFVGPDADAWHPVRQILRDKGIHVAECRRAWDQRLFPAARAGFFPFWHKARPALSAEN